MSSSLSIICMSRGRAEWGHPHKRMVPESCLVGRVAVEVSVRECVRTCALVGVGIKLTHLMWDQGPLLMGVSSGTTLRDPGHLPEGEWGVRAADPLRAEEEGGGCGVASVGSSGISPAVRSHEGLAEANSALRSQRGPGGARTLDHTHCLSSPPTPPSWCSRSQPWGHARHPGKLTQTTISLLLSGRVQASWRGGRSSGDPRGGLCRWRRLGEWRLQPRGGTDLPGGERQRLERGGLRQTQEPSSVLDRQTDRWQRGLVEGENACLQSPRLSSSASVRPAPLASAPPLETPFLSLAP